MRKLNGSSKVYNESNAEITGSSCVINGDRNSIYGNSNVVNGHNNKVYGDSNVINGNKNQIIGDHCVINGDNCNVKGKHNRNNGDNNKLDGKPMPKASGSSSSSCIITVNGKRVGSYVSGNLSDTSGFTDNFGTMVQHANTITNFFGSSSRNDNNNNNRNRNGGAVFNGTVTFQDRERDRDPVSRVVEKKCVFPEPWKEEPETGREGKDKCTICLEREACVIALPCAHISICVGCCLKEKDKMTACVMCRKKVEKYQRVFASGAN